MADLDAELLALAGGDSSGEDDTKHIPSDAKASSPSSHAGHESDSMNRASSTQPRMAQNPTIKVNGTVSRSRRKAKKDDSEEGEASSNPSSPESLQSAPMSESESETSPAREVGDDSPIFPVDGQFFSEKDKREIMSLSEVQRESILAERAQLRERKLQDQHLRRLLQARGNAEAKSEKKRKADTAELEDSPKRKSTRQKTTLGGRKVGDSSRIEAYSRQREENKARVEQRRLEGEERRNRKLQESSPLDHESDADADGDSEVEWDERAPSAQTKRAEEPAQLVDYERVRVGRDNFAQVCFYPGFNEAITGCYVRVNIGIDKASGESIYRVAQITGFNEGKHYAIESANGKAFPTNQYATVAIGKSQKDMPFIACSNQKFTSAEFERYIKTMTSEDLVLPTKTSLISKIADINNLINRSWTNEELDVKLKRAGVLQARFAHIEREDIMRRRGLAEKRGDETAIAQLDAELAAIDGPKLAFGTKLHQRPPSPPKEGLTQQERLAALNRANRKANTEDVRKAQRAEKKAERLAMEAVARGEGVMDPFARVKTRAKTHYDVNADKLAVPKAKQAIDDLFDGKSDGSRAGTPVTGSRGGTPTPKVKRQVTPLKQPQGGLPRIGRSCADDEIIGAMDFGIEIDI
ncbi:MAG: hypothetical protein Q9191_000791 [Dirinaria sp. TL-2023a]